MLMKIAGFDIGGANTDLAIIDYINKEQCLENIYVDFEYLPMWSKNEELGNCLVNLLGDYFNDIDAVGISMTAELVDAYETKSEGVKDIIKKVEAVFKVPVAYVSINGMLSSEEVFKNPLNVAAANWIATSQIAGTIEENCILVDIGSTTTDIIPIKNGVECAKGKSDFERLSTGELVYSGTLRTNLASLVDKIPLNNKIYRVASELFAISADVHNVLDNITLDDFSCATPDGAGKSKEDSMRRISRVLCADLDSLPSEDVIKIAEYIYKEQIIKTSEAICEVSKRNNIDKVVSTGLGREIIANKAAELAGLSYVCMDNFLTAEECVVAPAVGTALMMGNYLLENKI